MIKRPHHNDKHCRSYKGPGEPAARWEPAVARRAVSHSSSGAQACANHNGWETCGEPGWMRDEFHLSQARLHMRFSMWFRRDFDAILRTKPAPAYPARVFSRVAPRQNTAKWADIGKKGVFK